MRRVAITGLGAITAIGNSPEATFESALAARSGVRKAPEWAVSPVPPLAASAAFDPGWVKLRQRTAPMDRATAMAVAAARQAIEDSGGGLATGLDRTGIYWGTGMGAAGTLEDAYQGVFEGRSWRIKPTMVVTAMNNAAVAQISLEFGITGPTLTYSVACASSAVAIGEALRAIRYGIVDCAIVGGSEAPLTRGTLCAWSALRALAAPDPIDAARSCKPFATDRSGFVLGEGAGALVLEAADRARARGARIYGELAGYGTASDAAHIADPSSDGQARAIRAALTDADVDPADVGYINAHGTATITGDRVETASIRQAFGEHADAIAVSSTKALHGHVMGATGAIEMIIATLALHRRCVPPTAHLDHPDPDLDLDFVADGPRRDLALRAVASNSFAFGGTNAVLVALDPAARLRPATS
ncbi:MAG TPA: beta-ketoacyl-[acyl-carrier-protein] synthase family protein [Casimicrobiaceae bacterium]|nr:beta-ketoacyl-[acyl-carrier-protein] synthase family protein [Casimicrobiaceae bacterium]